MNDQDELRALAEKFGVPGVDLAEAVILIRDLELIPREVCETHKILPVLVRGEHLFLAMADPGDTRAVDEVGFVTGKKIYPYAALPRALSVAMASAHDAAAANATYYFGPNVSEARMRELGIDPMGAPPSTDDSPIRGSATPSGFIASVVAPIVTPLIPPAMEAAHDDEAEGVPTARAPVTMAPPSEAIGSDRKGAAGRYSAVATKLILVVDDEEEIRTMLKRVMVSRGHSVIEADSGPDALQKVKDHVPDLLILDAMLPGLHGFDVARRLKGSPRYGSIPIIMVSAVYRGWRVAEDLKASYGIFEYLEKPFRLNDVVDAATRALAARRTQPPPEVDLDLLSEDASKALEDGIAAYRAGDVDGAVEILRHGTKLDPLAYRLHFHLALLYGKKEQVFDGIGELEIAIDLNPKHFPSLKNLALLYERAGFKNRAVEMWERAVHVAPDAVSRAQVKERLMSLL